jgi:tRNA acetyltransferase TAN1
MENEAAAELFSLLSQIGDMQAEIDRTKISGLLTVTTNLQPIEVVAKIRKLVQDEPWIVRYIQRLIPIDAVVNTDVDEIREQAARLASRIGERETFRVTVEKRHSNISTSDLIRNVASVIDRKVSLEVQDWIVLIEIVGEQTGVSVMRPDAIFSAAKTKRQS